MNLPGPLVTVDWLADRVHTLRVIDTRWYLADLQQGRREYQRGHIPGAVFLDLETDLSGTGGRGRHPMPTATEFEAAMASAGVGDDTPVVAYDQSIGAVASRLWWLLRHFGHENAAVLDGGYAAWVAAGLDLDNQHPHIDPAVFTAVERSDDMASLHDVVDGAGSIRLIDARAPERYRGDTEPVDPKPGHIPGAENLPFEESASEGVLRSSTELRARLGDTSDMVVYCGSGVTACHLILAAAQAGLPLPRLYDGSWSDWASMDLPIAAGPTS